MKQIKHKLTLAFILTAVLISNLSPTAQERVLEESHEKRLNRLQPPVQVMDSTELKAGMTMGNTGSGSV